MKRIIIFSVIVALIIGGAVGYWSGITSRHISPVEERRSTTENSAQFSDVKNYFDSLGDEEKTCVESALASSYNEISTALRLPSPDEFEKIKSCTGLKSWPPGGFAHLESGYEQYEWKPDWEVNK